MLPTLASTKSNKDSENFLKISESLIKRAANRSFVQSSLASIVLRQALVENWLRFGKHVSFRHKDNAAAVRAYAEMTLEEFDGINARQNWANWRTIPRNLSGRAPAHALKAIDLCCGTGQSTAVLAYYLAPGSQLLGLEYNSNFVSMARKRIYKNANGQPVPTEFREQSVLETFRDSKGQVIENQSIDLVNSCGAIGHHFDQQSTHRLAIEITRILKPGGLAMLDSGRAGTTREQLTWIFTRLDYILRGSSKSCLLDPYSQLCFQKNTHKPLPSGNFF